jgi:uncharacterized membrane protein YdbT with pleckstrin-like domain
MGYVEQNLMPGEAVTYRARLHWVIYTRPVLLAVFGLILVLSSLRNLDLLALTALGVLLLVLAGLIGLFRWIAARTSEFAVTNKRVIVKVGLIRRHTLELLLSKVESIGVDQGILGRIVGYGNIVVIGTGGTKEPFKYIAAPLEFRKHVQAQALA